MRTGASAFPLVVVSLLAAMTFWLERAVRSDEARDGKNRHDPDYAIEKFTVRRFDHDGRLQHTIWADRMSHFPDDDSTDVVAPRVIYHTGARPTSISAEKAWISKDGKEVRLQDQVRAIRVSDGTSPDVVAETSWMQVFPDDEIGRTDRPIVITQGNSVVRGVGGELNHKTQIYRLRGPVSGTIVPRSHRKD